MASAKTPTFQLFTRTPNLTPSFERASRGTRAGRTTTLSEASRGCQASELVRGFSPVNGGIAVSGMATLFSGYRMPAAAGYSYIH